MQFRSESEEETIALGEQIAAMLPESGVVLLIGNLGAGKTTLTKGIAKARAGIGIEEVTSPTFTLVHEYSPRLVHIDLYRLETEREVRCAARRQSEQQHGDDPRGGARLRGPRVPHRGSLAAR